MSDVTPISRSMAVGQAFVEEMRNQGIHVGWGAPPRCCVCGSPFPCEFRSTLPKPDRREVEAMSSEQFLAALANIRGIVDALSVQDPSEWTDRDEAIDCWDQLDRLRSDLAMMTRQHAVELAGRIPAEYLHPRAGVIHTSTEVTVQWDGSGVLGALSARLVDPGTGEVVEAVATTTLREVIPAAGTGKVSSRWNSSGLRGAGVDVEKYRAATFGARVVRRGPKQSGRNREPPAS